MLQKGRRLFDSVQQAHERCRVRCQISCTYIFSNSINIEVNSLIIHNPSFFTLKYKTPSSTKYFIDKIIMFIKIYVKHINTNI